MVHSVMLRLELGHGWAYFSVRELLRYGYFSVQYVCIFFGSQLYPISICAIISNLVLDFN